MYECKIVLDSINPQGSRLTTMQVTFPRIVLAEFNTHRQFSRNSASSRAIPVEKMIQRVMEDPFIPEQFPANEKGMQSSVNLTGWALQSAREAWLFARDSAVDHARVLIDNHVHKQISNRLLEPFLWHTVIVSATEWSNFFALRCHRDAQPEIRTIAEMMRGLYESSPPLFLPEIGWHIPYITAEEWTDFNYQVPELLKIATGRIARVSYLTHEGKRETEKDIELHDRLKASGHMSPFEHCARVATYTETGTSNGNFHASWVQYRKEIANECR